MRYSFPNSVQSIQWGRRINFEFLIAFKICWCLTVTWYDHSMFHLGILYTMTQNMLSLQDFVFPTSEDKDETTFFCRLSFPILWTRYYQLFHFVITKQSPFYPCLPSNFFIWILSHLEIFSDLWSTSITLPLIFCFVPWWAMSWQNEPLLINISLICYNIINIMYFYFDQCPYSIKFHWDDWPFSCPKYLCNISLPVT